jgi:hypothetical protein
MEATHLSHFSVTTHCPTQTPVVDSDSEEAMAMHEQEDTILTAMMERKRAEALLTERQEQWLAENREELDAYNQHVEALGAFSDNVRSF